MIEDKPAFEVIEPSGHAYRIWADGRTEGFGESIVINRIPMIANVRVTDALRSRDEVGALDEINGRLA